MKHTAKTAPAPAPRKAATPAPAPDAPALATPAAALADAAAALEAASPAPAAPSGGVSDSLQKTVNEIARYYPAAILAAAATIEGQAPAPAPATASPAPATRCPDAGNVELSEKTLDGIEHFAYNMESGIHCRLKQYLRAAVAAGQCAQDESGLASVRCMFECLLTELADDFCRCCNMTLASHLDGRDIFAECRIGDNMIL